MILYNLVQYLVDQALGTQIVADVLTEKSETEAVLISQSGGTPEHYYDRTDWRFQALSRSKNPVDAQEACELVYVKLKNRFGLVLPVVTIDAIVYPAVTTYQISPIQAPSGIGADQENLYMWVFNFLVTTT